MVDPDTKKILDYNTSDTAVKYFKKLNEEYNKGIVDPDVYKRQAIRHEFDAKASKHDMYDTYLYAFKRCVKDAKVEAVMGLSLIHIYRSWSDTYPLFV